MREWLKAGWRFVRDSLHPVRRLNAALSLLGVGLTFSLLVALGSRFGTTSAVIVGLATTALLFLIQGARFEYLLHGANFGSLHAAETEGDVLGREGGVIRLRFHNRGQRGLFTASAKWLDDHSQDFGYSPWELKWSNERSRSEIAHDDDGYLLPATVRRNHEGTHTLYQHPQSSTEDHKFKNIEKNEPRMEIRILREKPEAESRWIVAFEVKHGRVRPLVIGQAT